MSKICVCGHFGGEKKFYDGQTVKTKNIYNELIKKYSKENVFKIDTYNWKKRPIALVINCVKNIIKCTDIIILPAHKGVKVFVPLFNILNKIYKRKIHYVIIGGWIAELIKEDEMMKRQLRKIDYLYAETERLITDLNRLNIENVYYLRNFKDLEIASDTEIKDESPNIKCCIFSRIEEEKGISDAIEVVKRLNEEKIAKIKLDIYGKIKEEYFEIFNKKVSDNCEFVNYKGVIEYNKSVEVLQNYEILLFPTRYKTEGIPGTIIDAYFSGIPVIASKWDNFNEVIREGKTRFGI